MDTEIKTLLADIKQSAERIIEVTLDKSFEQFEGDWMPEECRAHAKQINHQYRKI